jgi:hypothetical protein
MFLDINMDSQHYPPIVAEDPLHCLWWIIGSGVLLSNAVIPCISFWDTETGKKTFRVGWKLFQQRVANSQEFPGLKF